MNHISLRQTAVAWLTVLTLIAAPTIATGRFVCVKGMPQAGASCPRCHNQQAAPDNACCKWIEPAPTTGLHVAGPTLTPPTSFAFIAVAEAATPQLASTATDARITASPPGSSPPQTTILRL